MRRIAISQRVVQNAGYREPRDALAQDWSSWVAGVQPGAALLGVPNRPEGVANWWRSAEPEALILSGGNDWGEAPERDATERRLIELATARHCPILAVCRGLQVLNVCHGGTIESNVASQTAERHVAQDHAVELDTSAVSKLAGDRKIIVNSFHNQGVTTGGIATGFRAFAVATGGIVEGMMHEREPMLAVQWHPERPSPSATFDAAFTRLLFTRGAFWAQR